MATKLRRWELEELYVTVTKEGCPLNVQPGVGFPQHEKIVREGGFSDGIESITFEIKSHETQEEIGVAYFRHVQGWELREFDDGSDAQIPFASITSAIPLRNFDETEQPLEIFDADDRSLKDEVLAVWVSVRNLVKRGIVRSVAEELAAKNAADVETFGDGEE